MRLSIKSLEKMRTFKACFRTKGPLQTCGPELKAKLRDPFEPFSASYHVLLVNRFFGSFEQKATLPFCYEMYNYLKLKCGKFSDHTPNRCWYRDTFSNFSLSV